MDFQFIHPPPSCISGCLQSGMMAQGLLLNPQPRRLHSPSLPHRETSVDCCLSPPNPLLMGTLHCEKAPRIVRASGNVSPSAGELAVWAPRLLWGLVDLLNGATWQSIRTPTGQKNVEELRLNTMEMCLRYTHENAEKSPYECAWYPVAFNQCWQFINCERNK